ncbi:MAG TPA: hypothetical protein VLK27_13475 [Chthoniobacterales bacterium]|nr:hypothetical protein [Chthoniobacterales bacterium]
MKRNFSFAIVFLVAVAGCQKTKSKSASNQAKIDACSLITKDEVQKIQGSPVTDVKPNETSDDNFLFSQCFYSTQVFNESVSLAVTQRNSSSDKARDPKTFWKETFGRYDGTLKEQDGDEEKKKSLGDKDDERGAPPKKITGVGDDAWWSANRVGGAIYVLKDNVFIRISVGGSGDEESKIEKSKALAAKALSRL